MRHLYHRNVVLLFEVISDPAEDDIFMIMEVSRTWNEENKRREEEDEEDEGYNSLPYTIQPLSSFPPIFKY